MSQSITILGNKIVDVYDTRIYDQIPLHIGQLSDEHANMYVNKVSAAFRDLNFNIEFYRTTNDKYWQGLLGFYPFIVCIDIGSRPNPQHSILLSHYYANFKIWYDWCVENCQSEFIINKNGLVFENTDDYFLFKITFGDPISL